MNDVDTVEKLLEALESSYTQPLLIFKHSIYCPISARAFKEVTAYMSNHKTDLNSAMIVVQQAPDVSSQIASILGIEHESPQLILIKGGKPVWDISHFQITAENIKTSIESHSGKTSD